MASMFPQTFPKEFNEGNPEFQVFKILRGLPDQYSVVYSKKIKGGIRCKEETEIDFLIFDGKKNLICLEVKGGEISYNGSTGAWFQNGNPLSRSPDRQASAATHALIEFLDADARKINVNWALAFPNCSRPAGSGPIAEVPAELVLDSESLLNPTAAIEQICQYNEDRFGREGVTRYQASHIIDRLLRSVGFITKIGVRLLHDANQLVQATQQQLDVLDDLELNPRTAVKGYAGTGKTILAVEFAKRLTESGETVLLLFYNRMVANSVRYGLGRDSPIECTTFHSLARRVIDETEPNWWTSITRPKDDDFWENEVPVKLLESLRPESQRFDAIIVDEGQDFKQDWYEILEHLLAKKDGRFVVFFDENQDLFTRWTDLPWKENNICRKVLRKNCRNTRAIIDYLHSVIPTDMVGFDCSPTGKPVLIKEVSSAKEEVETLKQDVEEWLKAGVEPGKIIILINQPFSDSSLSSIDRVGSYPIEWMGRTYRPDLAKIQVTNIRNFKGLEADVVLISGVDESQPGNSSEMLYTQASRARLLLTIYRRKIEEGSCAAISLFKSPDGS